MSRLFDALLFDLDGVLTIADDPIPGTAEMLCQLMDARFPFLILTNRTMDPRSAIVESLRRHGCDLPIEAVQTPPAAAARWLATQNKPRIATFVTPQTRSEFEDLEHVPDTDEQGADYVVVGDMLEQWSYGALNRALRLLLNGARLVALGMGRYWAAADGMRLDTGAFVAALSFASGQKPVIIGKPSPEYFRAGLEHFDCPAQRVGMVGDDIISDIGAAQKMGIQGILVQTGKYTPPDLDRGVRPDYILPDATQVLPLVGLSPA